MSRNLSRTYASLKGKQAFDALDGQRGAQLERWRECSALTIPTVVPPAGFDGTSNIFYPWQSTGAEAVNTLVSKLSLSLFPPRIPFARLEFTSLDLKTLANNLQGDEEGRTVGDLFREAFVKIERELPLRFEVKRLREPLNKNFKQLVVCGNTCYYQGDEYLDSSNRRVYRLEDWVCKRSHSGEPIRIIIREYHHVSSLPEELCKVFESMTASEQRANGDIVEIYTDCTLKQTCMSNKTKRKKRQWSVQQFLAGSSLPIEEPVVYNVDDMPYRVEAIDVEAGEDYGRGLVELNLGDFRTLESGTQLIVEGSASASKVIYMVEPNGVVKVKDLAEVPNGGFVSGSAGEVNTIKTDKFYDFQGLQALLVTKERAIAKAFQMISAIQRDAERVTAEEIKLISSELEKNLGSHYTSMLPLQRFLALYLLKEIVEESDVLGVDISFKQITPVIVTGFQGLGRSQELEHFLQALEISQGIDTEGVFINKEEVLKRVYTLLAVDSQNILNSPAQVQAIVQQRQEAQLAQSVAPGVIQEAVKQQV